MMAHFGSKRGKSRPGVISVTADHFLHKYYWHMENLTQETLKEMQKLLEETRRLTREQKELREKYDRIRRELDNLNAKRCCAIQ